MAAKYCGSVSEKLSQVERMEKDLDTMAISLSQSVEEIDSSARKAQEKLERHFAGAESIPIMGANLMMHGQMVTQH